MNLVLFYYTLLVLLISILAAATCLSAYLVSRKRTSLFAFFGFLFYFFDVALVFQDDFILDTPAYLNSDLFFIGNPFASIVFGAGLLVSFWFLVCEFLGERRRVFLVAPGALFVIASTAIVLTLPVGNWEEFLFYSMREVMLYWMLIFIAVHYLRSKDEVERMRLGRHRKLYIVVWILGLCILLENIYFLLVFDPTLIESSALAFFPERNFAENALLLVCAFFACKDSFRTLALRFKQPPTHSSKPLDALISQNLIVYSRRHQLSARESEVLHLILLDKDNQNIASTMQLALSTVKVHVHKILQKTHQSNRKDLIRDFWMTS